MDDGQLIERVGAFPQLFVKSDARYKNNRMRENAWKSIGIILDETPEACEHRWKILRNKYTGLRREVKLTPSGSGASEITWPYFKSMSFLDPYSQTRKSFSNITLKNVKENAWDSFSQMTELEENTKKENFEDSEPLPDV
ncbi:unnamed protein product [Phaedon cochleariae]|uniref:MADF domain-containing protein n=1 Tax=Phaedon cochleariae TaxID=80249 RepID=A0A9N9SFZ7_PHACE|nr:unnamed protein product [Phaedon cochleariae]